MEYDWIWQGVFSNILWLILAAIGAAVLSFLRAKWPKIAAPTLYGIVGFTCMVIVSYSVRGHSFFSPPVTTSANVQDRVREWLVGFGDGVQSKHVEGTAFTYRATDRNGVAIDVFRESAKADSIQLQMTMTISPQHQDVLAHLSPDDARNFVDGIRKELIRDDISVNFVGGEDYNHFNELVIGTGLLIDGLTEDQFARALDKIGGSAVIARMEIQSRLKSNGKKL